MYPSLLLSFNITRETKLATVLCIDNTKRAGKIIDIDKVRLTLEQCPGVRHYDVETFFSNAIYVESNAIRVGQVFGLPDLEGVDVFIRENFPDVAAAA